MSLGVLITCHDNGNDVWYEGRKQGLHRWTAMLAEVAHNLESQGIPSGLCHQPVHPVFAAAQLLCKLTLLSTIVSHLESNRS